MERLIYFAGGKSEKKERLSALAAGLNLRLMEVSPLLTGQTIGFLSGIDGFEERPLKPLETPPVLREEALIFQRASPGSGWMKCSGRCGKEEFTFPSKRL